MSRLFILSILSLFLISLTSAQIWPQPYHQVISDQTTTFSTNPQVTQIDSDIFKNALQRYLKIIFGKEAHNYSHRINGEVSMWNVRIANVDTKLRLGADESYTLKVSQNLVELTANEVWGALRGLESLSQLIERQVQTSDTAEQTVSYTSKLADITDKPRYPWRGLLIDVSRHFLSPRTIKRTIDALAYNKMNVLHIHLTDAQSFPIQVKQYPDLSNKALWHEGMQYTAEILSDIVQYAYERGVRVIPEVDVPGHAYSWGLGYPESVAKCPRLMDRTHNINNVPLNMGKEIVYDLIKALLDEMSDVFVDDYVHMGGDEVVTSCWKEDESITQFMKDHNLATYDDFEGYFESRLETLYRHNNRKMVSWQELSEIKTNQWKLPNDSIIQVWKEAHDLPSYTSTGNKLLLSGGWYLDKAVPDSLQVPPYLFGDNWKNMYAVEPEKYLNEHQYNLLLGGEVCQFGEQVDEHTIDSRIWPRAAAVAERLWSPKSVNDTSSAEKRLIRHRCEVLVKRGIHAFPLRPDFCPYVWDM
eukprot:CAMPEP_0117445152 /NCGR_PEP_ID=MMETSP0759-20121206/5639_1 /TAXON_ID=63605 /ORGANISM="Percolomonas cosmopolitus, Strain WS" /LENGTH=528 /DNA_ID=CAMNT_0005237301 /DNA_START=8 /DNA_END=1594 /DNA_ORIENTATION=+